LSALTGRRGSLFEVFADSALEREVEDLAEEADGP
jgi:hypothetical protein